MVRQQLAWVVGAELKGCALERWAQLAQSGKVLIASADGDLIDDVHGEVAPGRTELTHRIEQFDGNLWRQIGEESFREPGGRQLRPKTG